METQTSTAPSPSPAPVATPSVNPQEVLQKMLDGLGLQTKVELYHMDDAPLLHIATAEPGRLIGKHGQTLQHLQFLLNRVLQRFNPDAPRVIVDCERYRERQRDDLIRTAWKRPTKCAAGASPCASARSARSTAALSTSTSRKTPSWRP